MSFRSKCLRPGWLAHFPVGWTKVGIPSLHQPNGQHGGTPTPVQQALPLATCLLCHTRTGKEGSMSTRISSWRGGCSRPVMCPGVQIPSTGMHTCLGPISEVTRSDGESTMASWDSQQSPENAKHSGTSRKAQQEKMHLSRDAVRWLQNSPGSREAQVSRGHGGGQCPRKWALLQDWARVAGRSLDTFERHNITNEGEWGSAFC